MTPDLEDTMDQDKFLAFKGLKQYSPESGWESLGSEGQDQLRPQDSDMSLGAQTVGLYAHQQVSTGTHARMQDAANKIKAPRAQAEDPLINELFDQLRQPVEDELSSSWKLIANNVNLLTQRMDQQRLLKAQLKALEEETQTLRIQILTHLEDVQKTADRQLSVARLRVEVSNMAKSKLSDKLQKI
jgi:hypothetical protein